MGKMVSALKVRVRFNIKCLRVVLSKSAVLCIGEFKLKWSNSPQELFYQPDRKHVLTPL